MKAPALRGLSIEDFRNLTPDVRKGLEQLSEVLSPFLADTTDALAGGLTLGNLDAIIKMVEVTSPGLPAPDDDDGGGGAEEVSTVLGNASPNLININQSLIRRVGAEVIWDGGIITVLGTILNQTLGVVPLGFRPSHVWRGAVMTSDQSINTAYYGVGNLDIGTSGNVVLRKYPTTGAFLPGAPVYISFSNIRYRLEGYVPPPPPPPPTPIEAPDAGPVTVALESNGRRLKSGRPTLVLPIRATEVNGTRTSEVVVPTIAWEHTKDGIVIKKIRGLDPGKRYRLTLLITA